METTEHQFNKYSKILKAAKEEIFNNHGKIENNLLKEIICLCAKNISDRRNLER